MSLTIMHRTHLNISAFKKVNEIGKPTELEPTELTRLINMSLDSEIGTAKLRGGFKRWNPTYGDDPNPLDTTGTINSIADLVDNDGINYLFASIGTKIRKAVSASGLAMWADVKTGLANLKARIINYGGNFLITNGYDKPFYVNNVLISGSSVFDMDLLSPDISVVSIVVNEDMTPTNGGLTPGQHLDTGSYRYLFVYFDSNDESGNPSAKLASIDSGTAVERVLTASNYAFNLPTTNNARVTTLKIFRTKKNVLDKFYLIKTFDIADTNKPLTSGTLEAGQPYIIETYVSGDDFLAQGALSNATGVIFTATTADPVDYTVSVPTDWSHGSTLRKLFRDNNLDANVDTTEVIEYMNTPNSAKYIVAQSDIVFLANINKTYTNRVLPAPQVNTGTINVITSTGTTAPTGAILAGQYSYGYSYVDVNGNESAMTVLITKANPYVLGSSNSWIALGNFAEPLLSASPLVLDSTIKKIRFYRTKELVAHPTSLYYYIGDTDPDIIQMPGFQDNIPDSALATVYPYANYGTAKKGALDTINLPSSIVYSNLYKFLEFPELNYIEIYPDQGDIITGIFNDDIGVMIFKNNSICKLYTNGSPENWQVVKLSENIGCDQPDSIYKSGLQYFFVFRNRPYLFTGQGEPKPIGLLFTKTFDSVTGYLGCTYYTKNEWFVLSVKISSAYYLLCYDTKLETWYKFIVSQADCIIRKEFGVDAGKFLIGGASQFITTYDETQAYDTDLDGTRKDIVVELQTKTFTFSDNFMIARLRFFFIDYIRLLGTSGSITFKINELKTGVTNTYTDTNEILLRLQKTITDSMGNLKLARKLNFEITGVAITQLNALRLDYNMVKRGYG